MFEMREGAVMEEAGYVIVFLYLCLMACYDIKKKEISWKASIAAALVLVIRQIYLINQDIEPLSVLFGITVGLMLIVISILSRGEIGVGDGVLFVVSGLLFGLYENGVLLFLSLLFAAFVSGALLVTRRVGRTYALPFAPFVFAGYGVMCVWKICG